MAAKATLVIPISGRPDRRQLAVLYARRIAIDNLIESLEDYSRFKARRIEGIDWRKIKTA